MASSSFCAASSQSPKKYDVFINFRGDTRFNFTSHLHAALCRNDIETYIDYRLEKGDELWPSFEEAIEDSTLFLAIFSEKYASSTWCLNELVKILECTKGQRQVVMPVFYKIEPSVIRKQLGSYQKAFAEYEQKNKITKEQLQKWKEALTYASNLSGWSCNSDRDEAELTEDIAKCLKQKLHSMYQSEGGHLENLVGIHEKIVDVESLLYKESQEVQFIGIWGMGGIGKTTLARVVYEKLRFKYKGCCFLENVREESKKYGITTLRIKLICQLLGNKESPIGMPNEVTPYDIRRLSRKRNLIVLDDVDDQEHLEILVGRRDWFGVGSTILITTRNKQVLSKEVDDMYEVEPLNFYEAFHLFSHHAFKNDSPPMKLRGLAKDVISYAKGIPLALKVLGSFLHGKSKKEWESQLEKLKKMLDPKIHDVLKVSFEGLDHEEKNIFLDVVCLFKGCHVDDMKNLLDGCGYSTTIGLKVLEEKALLNVHGKTIFMHDLIQKMGREIIREESLKNPEKRSRLWNSSEIFQVLNDNMGTGAIEAIILNASEIEEMNLSPQAFCSMPNLRFLDFHTNFGEQVNRLHCRSDLKFLPNKLRLLRWEMCPLKSLPATFRAENLLTMIMPNSNLTKLWDGDQNLVNLRKIDLHRCKNLIEVPNFSKAKHLKHVNFSHCSKLHSVHPSILSLHSLEHLDLQDCKALSTLTSDIHLKSLKTLDLAGCSGLRKFSVISERCRFNLDLSRTAINDDMFSNNGFLGKIHRLYLFGCDMTNLPYKLANWSDLRHLLLDCCHNVARKLSFIFDRFRALKSLSLDRCHNLFELPDNISLLSSLVNLSLSKTDVETLPVSIMLLSNLRHLDLTKCKRLRSLPALPLSISELNAYNCISLETLYLTFTTTIIEEEEEEEEEEENKDKEDEYDDDDDEEEEDEEDEEDGEVLSCQFDFRNCMKMDQQSINAIEAKAMLSNRFVEVVYPGNKIPEWFTNKSKRSSITLDLYSVPQPWDCRFIFCAIVSKCEARIHFEWLIDGQYVYNRADYGMEDYRTFSDHVHLWYVTKSDFPLEVQRIIEEMETNDQSNTSHVEIKFEVDTEECLSDDETIGKIKECGVCPTSAPECRNYTEQVGKTLQPWCNSIGMEVGCSYHNTGDKEVISRKRKYHSFIEFQETESRKK